MKIRTALLTVVLGTAAFSLLSGCGKKTDPDELVIIQLKKAGSDLSKPHKIEFYLYFPTQSAAEQSATTIRKSGFEVEARQAAKDTNWLCLATKVMVPKLSDIQQIGRDFEKLTATTGGEYDGWETSVVK